MPIAELDTTVDIKEDTKPESLDTEEDTKCKDGFYSEDKNCIPIQYAYMVSFFTWGEGIAYNANSSGDAREGCL